jgi:4-carboxymuconolactone decarboxylase
MKKKINLYETDGEFMRRHESFAYDEVANEPNQTLDDETRNLAILAALIGCQGLDEYRVVASRALDHTLTPVEVKEVLYQAVAYLGMGRVHPFLLVTNELMLEKDIKLPLAPQATTTLENRLDLGIEAQVEIFGENMKDFWKGGHINRWLAANCFGDYYKRGGLDLKQREMITFCFLAAQGGCEPQLTSHIYGNINLGNDLDFLTRVVSQILPYIGYPRSLNVLACIKSIEREENIK